MQKKQYGEHCKSVAGMNEYPFPSPFPSLPFPSLLCVCSSQVCFPNLLLDLLVDWGLYLAWGSSSSSRHRSKTACGQTLKQNSISISILLSVENQCLSGIPYIDVRFNTYIIDSNFSLCSNFWGFFFFRYV